MKTLATTIRQTAALLLTVLLAMTLAPPDTALAEGGSEGGTNVNAGNQEPVEFDRLGQPIQIQPDTFENLYKDLVPRLQALDDRVPGLWNQLHETLRIKPWLLTAKEFPRRREGERQPIFQDESSVLINIQGLKEMSHDQRKKAWFHELVRGYAMKYLRCNDHCDDVVEALTPLLYYGYNLSSTTLTQRLNDTIFRKGQNSNQAYISRGVIRNAILDYGLVQFHDQVCNGIMRRSGSSKVTDQIAVYLKKIAPMKTDPLFYEDYHFSAQPNLADPLDNIRQIQLNLRELRDGCSEHQHCPSELYPNERNKALDLLRKNRKEAADMACSWLRKSISFIRAKAKPILQIPNQDGDNDTIRTLDDAIRLLQSGRTPANGASGATNIQKQLGSAIVAPSAGNPTRMEAGAAL